MRKPTTHFEQVPLLVVKKIAAEEPKQTEQVKQKPVTKNTGLKKAS